jgi:hypothetical protein
MVFKGDLEEVNVSISVVDDGLPVIPPTEEKSRNVDRD